MAWFEIKFILKWAFLISIIVLIFGCINYVIKLEYNHYKRSHLPEHHMVTDVVRTMHMVKMSGYNRLTKETEVIPESFFIVVNINNKEIAVPVDQEFYKTNKNIKKVSLDYRQDSRSFYFDKIEKVN